MSQTYFISNRLNQMVVTDGAQHMIATISLAHLLGATRLIKDSSGNLILTTHIVHLEGPISTWNTASTVRYTINQQGLPIATAKFFYSPDYTPSSLDFFTPSSPPSSGMEIETPYGLWHAKRHVDNSLTFYQGNTPLATLSPFFVSTQQKLEVYVPCDPLFMVSIFVLGYYMMHEDDSLVV